MIPRQQHGQQKTAPWVVGAYSASPTKIGHDLDAEDRYLEAVLSLPGVVGLEVPLRDSLHEFGDDWLLSRLRPGNKVVLTMLSGTLAHMRDKPSFGIASPDGEGRGLALEDAQRALSATKRIIQRLGEDAVVAVEFHAAPVWEGDGKNSLQALTESLTEIASWDWGGARVVLEHCDAKVAHHPHAKGLLPLELELEAVTAANEIGAPRVGVSVNWGRSVIEGRDAKTAIEHIRMAKRAHVLSGLVFSGCAGIPTRYGAAWADVHVPPSPGEAHLEAGDQTSTLLERDSLLGPGQVCDAVTEAGSQLDFRAVKVAAPPRAALEQRIAAVAQSVQLVTEAASCP